MAVVNSITFDQASYTPGQMITLTADYTPDTPGVVPQTFTATVVISNTDGTPVAQDSAPFTVNTPQAGDTVSVSDTGSRTWAQSSDNGTVAVFTATA